MSLLDSRLGRPRLAAGAAALAVAATLTAVPAGPPAAAAGASFPFDTDTDGNGVADYWTVAPYGTAKGSAKLVAGRHGRAQSLTATRVKAGGSYRLIQQTARVLPVRSGEKVAGSIWYRGTAPGEVALEARSADGAWRTVARAALAKTTAWKVAKPSGYTVSGGVSAIRASVRLARVGQLSVDDLSLSSSAPHTPTTPSIPTTPTVPTTPRKPTTPTTPTGVLFAPVMPLEDGLVTNEYAFWNAGSTARNSADWQLGSGSLFSKAGTGWTGVPDDRVPNATSSTGNNSAIFRVTTRRRDFGDAAVRTDLRVNRMGTTGSTPPVAWDGVHIFLRYQREENLYYASVARRDGHVVLKKKCLGGSSNGGTYYTLADKSGFVLPVGAWTSVGAAAKTNANGTVTLSLERAGTTILTATDSGIGCPAITKAGATGLRGDNTDFQFRGFTVRAN